MNYDDFKNAWHTEHTQQSINDAYAEFYRCMWNITDLFTDALRLPMTQELVTASLVAKPAEEEKKLNAIIEAVFEDNKPDIAKILKNISDEIKEAYGFIRALMNLKHESLKVPVANKKSYGIMLRLPAINNDIDFPWFSTSQPSGTVYQRLQHTYWSCMKLLTAWADWIDTRTDEGLRKPRTDAEWKPMFVDAAGNAL